VIQPIQVRGKPVIKKTVNELEQVIFHGIPEGKEIEVFCTVYDGNESVDIQYQSIETLKKKTWLNDQVINAYSLLLMKRDREVNPSKADQTYIYNTEFSHLLYSAETQEEQLKFNYDRVKNYLRKHKFNVFEYKRAIFPINFDQIHWVNIKAEFVKGGNGVSSIEVSNFDIVGYDSMNMIPVMKRWINFIEEYLLLEYNCKL
jgi:Ulp1 family protease